MESKKTSFWITYRDPDSSPTDSDTYGKWVCTFTDRSMIARICQDAVAEHIVPESKYTNADAGQCCFYLNGTDLTAQERILRYLILNEVIPETVYGRLDNIPFELEQRTGGASPVPFCLDHFINLYTGEFII